MTLAPSHSTPVESRATANALADRVQLALERVTWPAHPATLIECAEHAAAAPDVIEALRNLPDEAFGSFPEVSASIVATHMSKNSTPEQRNAAPH